MTTPADDAFTELVDADIPRVDLVDRAANGLPFLLAKSEDGPGGLVSPDVVRGLIGKANPDPQPADHAEQVTMSGSPAAIAKLIHQAAVRAENDDVAKGPLVEEPASTESDLDPTTVLAAPDDGPAPGNPAEPGSPAWEAIDAATARKWTLILARAKHALSALSEREELEAVAGDMKDAFHAMELCDAADAVDYAISILAPFAVGEQAEADCHADMAAVGKALAGFDVGQLDTIETLAHISKAGRILSARNEAAIRTALESLQKVLASLPAAPEPDSTEAGQPVTKEETDMPETEVTDAPDTIGKGCDRDTRQRGNGMILKP
ncbi:hypothetical protein [Streptomyces alfalfae]|uniref:hypothetical protein n=1 Tax=Streptomyces alfalfae TaxID=1642299 RepID=UPI002810AC1A|nr:hypothetical protein [Streptomyces alfalfae]